MLAMRKGYRYICCKLTAIYRSLLILLVLVTSVATPLQAQMRFYTTVSEGPVRLGQTFQVQYVIEEAGSVEQFNLPQFPSFKVLDSFDNRNPVLSSQSNRLVPVYSRIVVLMATREGRFTLPPASAVVNGKKIWSNFATIQIGASENVRPESNESVQVEQNSQLKAGEKMDEKLRRHVFLRAVANTRQCYAGEGITVSYKLYSALNTSAKVLRRPALSGFSVLEMVDAYDSKPEEEWLDGKAYYVNLVRKVQLFPLQAGAITLEPAQVECTVHFSTQPEGDKIKSLLNRTGGNGNSDVVDYVTTISSAPLTIQVKPLPVQNNENFGGAVGAFSLRMETDSPEVGPGSLVKVRLVVEGTGNFPLIVAPSIQWPVGVDTAEPEVGEHFDRFVFPLKGEKHFGYSFTAPESGEVVIPAVKMLYFDPSSVQYKYCQSKPLVIKVGRSSQSVIVPSSVQSPAPPSVPRERYWFALVVVAIVSWVLYQFRMGKKDKQTPTSMPVAVTLPVAKTVIEIPSSLKQPNAALPVTEYYRGVQQFLWESISVVTKLEPIRWNKTDLEAALLSRGCSRNTIQSIQELLQQCELALYGMEQGNDAFALVPEKLEGIVKELNAL